MQLGAVEIGSINPDGYYLYCIPGSMEVESIFRAQAVIADGLVVDFKEPTNQFYCVPEHNLVLFDGAEPNLSWRSFAANIFEAAQRLGVKRIFCVGSVVGRTTHTRAPRISCAASDKSLLKAMEPLGVRFANYNGPVSLVTWLMVEARKRRVEMVTLLAEIPPYIQGRNPKSIAANLRTLTAALGLTVDLEPFRSESDEWEKRVNEAVEEQEELAEQVRRLEAEYDDEVFNTQMGDLKELLEKRGVRLD